MAEEMELYFNTRLYQLVSSFPSKFVEDVETRTTRLFLMAAQGQNPVRNGPQATPTS
jgi:hypothetical protein